MYSEHWIVYNDDSRTEDPLCLGFDCRVMMFRVFPSTLKINVQKDDPEEDMDTRGGGQAAEDRRIVKEEDYASDNDADFMEEDRPQQHQQAQHAQQAAGFENNSRGATPGRGSAVRFFFFKLFPLS